MSVDGSSGENHFTHRDGVLTLYVWGAGCSPLMGKVAMLFFQKRCNNDYRHTNGD